MNAPVHILFIDNDPEIRALAFEALAQEFPGLSFSGVNDEESLRLALDAGGFDIVVTDYILHWTDGQRVLQTIKQRYVDCPVIIFTVTGEDQAILKAIRRGGSDDPAHRWPQFLELLFVAVRAGIEKAELVRGRQRATEALRVTESRFRSVFETASDAIVLADADGNIVDWNGAASGIFGYEEAEVVGKPLTMLMPERYRERHLAGLKRYRDVHIGSVVGRTVEFHGRRKDGAEFPLELSIGTWESERGCGFSGVMRDITDRRRAEAELRHSYEQLRELSARVAKIQEEERMAIARELHDVLGQALTGLGFDLARLAKRLGVLNPDEHRESLEQMSRVVDAMVDQVRRISAELRPALLDELGLSVAIESQAEGFSARTGIRCIVRSNVVDKAIPVSVTSAVYRIFQECLTNVARHARAHRVTVTLRRSNGDLLLEMRDDGQGIPEGEIDNPRSLGITRNCGTGPADRRRCGDHRRPRAGDDRENGGAAGIRGRGTGASVIRALVADDHAVVRRGLREMLGESAEISVQGEASDGREVMELIRARDWDVLVLDLNLPDASGLDLLQRVKEERPKLPVLILTICSEDEFAVRAFRSGASGYLTKRSAPEELVAAVLKVVGGGRYVSPALAERLALLLDGSLERPPHDRLSDREFQVFRMLTAGRTSAQTAEALHLSVKTVSTYRARILEKMNMRTNAELAVYAARHGLVD